MRDQGIEASRVDAKELGSGLWRLGAGPLHFVDDRSAEGERALLGLDRALLDFFADGGFGGRDRRFDRFEEVADEGAEGAGDGWIGARGRGGSWFA